MNKAILIDVWEERVGGGEKYWNRGFAKIRNWSSPTNHKWKEVRLKVVRILKCNKSGLAEYSDIHFEGIEPAKSLVSC